MQFNCELCKGVCCLNPPNVRVYEGSKAVEMGASLISFRTSRGYYVSIRPNGDTCPFWENGNCSVYENRFQACRNFECEMIGKDVREIVSVNDVDDMIKSFTASKERSINDDGVFWSEKEIEKYGVSVVEEAEFIRIVMMRDPFVFGRLVIESLNAHLATRS